MDGPHCFQEGSTGFKIERYQTSRGGVNNACSWYAGENLTGRILENHKVCEEGWEAVGHLFCSFDGDFPWVDWYEKSHAYRNDSAS